jgi:hypothetical protein
MVMKSNIQWLPSMREQAGEIQVGPARAGIT